MFVPTREYQTRRNAGGVSSMSVYVTDQRDQNCTCKYIHFVVQRDGDITCKEYQYRDSQKEISRNDILNYRLHCALLRRVLKSGFVYGRC